MKEENKKERITRRGIFELGSAAFATAGVLAGVDTAKGAQDSGRKVGAAKPDAALMTRKIALEEHFAPPDIVEPYAQRFSPEVWRQISQSLEDMGPGRIAEMDPGGVEFCIISLTAPGIQAVPNVSQAIAMARRTNDYLSTSQSIPTV
jgi:2,3-dihydroxybenzoate decarboxylase